MSPQPEPLLPLVPLVPLLPLVPEEPLLPFPLEPPPVVHRNALQGGVQQSPSTLQLTPGAAQMNGGSLSVPASLETSAHKFPRQKLPTGQSTSTVHSLLLRRVHATIITETVAIETASTRRCLYTTHSIRCPRGADKHDRSMLP
jgi:hypothetical protein